MVVTRYLHTGIQPCNRATIRNRTPCTVIVAGYNPRSDQVQLTDNLVRATSIVSRAGIIICILDIGQVQFGTQPLGDLHIQIRTGIELFTSCIRKHTGLVQITDRSHIAHILRTTGNIQVVTVLYTGLVSQVIPVCIRIKRICSVLELLDFFICKTGSLTFCLQSLIIHAGIFVRTQTVDHIGSILEADIAAIRNFRLAGRTTLGGNQNNTVRCLRSIDGSRSSIFQNRNTFNVIGVNGTHGFRFHTINQNIRRSGIQSTGTTYTDTTTVHTRSTVRTGNGYTRHQTLQTTAHVLNRTVLQLLFIYRSYRTRKIGLLLNTISYDNHLIQCFCVFL